MKQHPVFLFLIITVLCVQSCNGQANNTTKQLSRSPSQNLIVGGPCDGCELMYIGMPENIPAVDTSAGWKEEGQKLIVKGKAFQPDGKTPAAAVIIYYWHTNGAGRYTAKDGMDAKARRHGYLRGWVRTDSEGNYAIYTSRPAAYPGERFAAHIHTLIKEPHIGNEYYIDEFVFDDDPLLTSATRSSMQNRGGSGILKPVLVNGVQVAQHDIILGLNIPGYPKK